MRKGIPGRGNGEGKCPQAGWHKFLLKILGQIDEHKAQVWSCGAVEACNFPQLCHLLTVWLQFCDCGEHWGALQETPHMQNIGKHNPASGAACERSGHSLSQQGVSVS